MKSTGTNHCRFYGKDSRTTRGVSKPINGDNYDQTETVRPVRE